MKPPGTFSVHHTDIAFQGCLVYDLIKDTYFQDNWLTGRDITKELFILVPCKAGELIAEPVVNLQSKLVTIWKSTGTFTHVLPDKITEQLVVHRTLKAMDQ